MKSFPYTVVYTDNRNAYAKIQEDGTVLLSLPRRAQGKQELFEKLLISGEKLYLRHARHTMYSRWNEAGLFLFGEQVPREDLPISFSDSSKKKEHFLKQELHSYATAWIETFCEQIPSSYRALTIRKAKSQWGSCSYEGKIMLNLSLVHLPSRFLQYVIAHEVAHLIHHHHQAPFWELVQQLFPAYLATRKELKQLSVV